MLRVCVALLVLTVVGSVPLTQNVGFIGEGTSDLALQLLQSDKYQNQVYSPLGYNTLLAIFAEGARGETKKELADVLHLPSSQEEARLGYQTVLRRFSEKYKLNQPEMKNWFYIYKNFTVDEDLQAIIRKYYLTEVKVIERPHDFEVKHDKISKVKVPSGLQGKPTDHLIDVDEDVESIIDGSKPNTPHKSDGEEATSGAKPVLLDEKKPLENMSEMKEPVLSGANELPVKSGMNEEAAPPDEKASASMEKVEEQKVTQETGSAKEEDKKMEQEKKPDVNEVKNTDEVHETMVAMQRNVDMENEIFSKIESSSKVKDKESVPRILAFNGFFFKGQWNLPFVKKDADESRPFYTTAGKAIVPTLHAEGVFRTADVPELNAQALELKYDGDRYTLLLVVPNEVDGATKMDFKNVGLKQITDKLSEKSLEICMPAFDVVTISKPSWLGLKNILSPELADLSAFSKDSGLYLDELVQVTTVEVNSNSTEAVLLTASLASSRSEAEKFQVNRPFYFFLRDNIDGIVIVNGLIVDPSVRSDLKRFR